MSHPTLCIFKTDDADALLAAWAAHRAQLEVEFISARWGDNPFETMHEGNKWAVLPSERYQYRFKDRDILILGDLYPLPTLHAMAAEARSVLVLASGEAGREDLKPPLMPFQNWSDYCRDELRGSDSRLAAITDPTRSVAGIAWDYFHQRKLFGAHETEAAPRPRIIDLVEDHSLHSARTAVGPIGEGPVASDQHSEANTPPRYSDETRAFVAVLRSYDWTDLTMMFKKLSMWDRQASRAWPPGRITDDPAGEMWSELLHEGRAILRADRQRLAREGRE